MTNFPEADDRPDDRPDTRLATRTADRVRSAPPAEPADGWSVTWIAGPAAGRSIALPPGRHLVGRAAVARVRTDDRALEPFHAQLDVRDDGTIELTQLAGRAPIRLGGDVLEERAQLDRAVSPTVLEIGTSRLEIRWGRVREPASHRGDGAARSTVVREPRAVPVWQPSAIEVDEQPRTTAGGGLGGLVPALIAFAGSVLLAVLMGQPMFVVFGALGAMVAVAGWGVQHLGDRKGKRRDEQVTAAGDERFHGALEAQRALRRAYHLASTGTLVDAARIITAGDRAVWSRRPDHGDAFTVSLGIGAVRWQPSLAIDRVPERCWGALDRAAVIEDVPIPCALDEGAHVAVGGPHALAVVRSLVVQLAAQTGPADWQLLVVTDRADEWSWAAALGHAHDALGGSALVVDEHDLGLLLRDADRLATRHMVVVTDRADLLAARTGPLRRLLAGEWEAACITVLDDDVPVPAVCRSVLTTRADARGSWCADVRSGELPVPVHVAGLSHEDATDLALALAGKIDPEDPGAAHLDIPSSVALVDLLDATSASEIAERWCSAGPDALPAAPLGRAADGLVEIDLVRDGPHGLLAGTTGAGKSELLRSLVVGLAARLGPDRLTFVLVDYKGGSTFDALTRLPHVVGTVTDLDDHLAERALRSLRAELTRRERLLRDVGATDLADARRRSGVPVLPRLVVVIDEFAALAVEHAEFLHALVGIAQRGRSLGVHLLLATQRPSGVISDDIRANTDLRLALRLQDAADSLDVIGDGAASALPRHLPGRAVMRLGPTEFVTFQTARCPEDDLTRLVDAIVAANKTLGVATPSRPWCEPLPALLDHVQPAGAVGVIDVPDEQRQEPLSWNPARGHLAVLGAPGSGVSSTLVTLVTAAIAADQMTDVVVIDALGDPAWDAVDLHPRCRGVIRLHDRERLRRALVGLVDDGGAARSSSTSLVVIDGFGVLRDELDDLDRTEERDALERCLADASSSGCTLLLGADGVLSVPASVLARIPNRWLLHLNDAHDAAALGVPSSLVPPSTPGRLVIADRHVVAQVVRPGSIVVGARVGIAPVERIGVLGRRVDPQSLAAGSRDEHGVVLPVGVAFDDLATASLDIADGEHVLVLGPARSGRSSALLRLAAAWQSVHPGRPVHVVAPRRSPLRDAGQFAQTLDGVLDAVLASEAGPTLLVVDDAELVDDPDGRLAALLSERRPGHLVVAAGRGDAIRQSYGHWTTVVRRSRRGLVMAAAGEVDGDVLGVALPRRIPIPPRPGLAHLVADGTTTLVQCALDATTPIELSRPGVPVGAPL